MKAIVQIYGFGIGHVDSNIHYPGWVMVTDPLSTVKVIFSVVLAYQESIQAQEAFNAGDWNEAIRWSKKAILTDDFVFLAHEILLNAVMKVKYQQEDRGLLMASQKRLENWATGLNRSLEVIDKSANFVHDRDGWVDIHDYRDEFKTECLQLTRLLDEFAAWFEEHGRTPDEKRQDELIRTAREKMFTREQLKASTEYQEILACKSIVLLENWGRNNAKKVPDTEENHLKDIHGMVIEFILDPMRTPEMEEICKQIREQMRAKTYGRGRTNYEMEQFGVNDTDGKDNCRFELDDDRDDCFDEDENME